MNRISLTQELHILEAHLLHYHSLLHAFELSVSFIENTPNPAMESSEFSDEERQSSKDLMKKECGNLLSEINRLEKRRMMLSDRLKNAMQLAFSTVNIEDSRQMRTLTQATVRDSAAMKQVFFFSQTNATHQILINGSSEISYLTMVFLPASLTAVSIEVFCVE